MKEYRALQGEIQTLFVTKQQSLSQLNENSLVKGELDLLDERNTVYKLVGPVLMKVDLDEAKQNVSKRIEFIEGELVKVDKQIADKQGLQVTVGEEITEMQQKMQA